MPKGTRGTGGTAIVTIATTTIRTMTTMTTMTTGITTTPTTMRSEQVYLYIHVKMNTHNAWDKKKVGTNRPSYWNKYLCRNECEYGCPVHTHCEWGFCECDPGYEKAWGVCRVVRNESPQNHLRGQFLAAWQDMQHISGRTSCSRA